MLRAFLWALRMFRWAPLPHQTQPRPENNGSSRAGESRYENGADLALLCKGRADQLADAFRTASRAEGRRELADAYFSYLANDHILWWNLYVSERDWVKLLMVIDAADKRVRWLMSNQANPTRKGA